MSEWQKDEKGKIYAVCPNCNEDIYYVIERQSINKDTIITPNSKDKKNKSLTYKYEENIDYENPIYPSLICPKCEEKIEVGLNLFTEE